MKRRLSLSKRKPLNTGVRRKQLIKKLQRKVHMRRQDFVTQIEMTELAQAG